MPEQSPIAFDAEEFGKLFSGHRVYFVKIAYSFVRDLGEAEDIVNDSFVYVLEHRDTLSWDRNIKSYLYQCVKNRCYTHLRERQRLMRIKENISKSEFWQLETAINALQNDDLTRKLFSAEVYDIYCRELARMPELTRAIYQAHRRDEMTHQQIAEKFQVTPRKVATEMQRALSMLRLSLKDYLGLLVILSSCLRNG